MVIWNHANFIVHSRSSHRALSLFFAPIVLFRDPTLCLFECNAKLVPNLIQTRKHSELISNRFKPVWTSTNRSDSLLSSRTESKSFIFIPIPIPSIFINDFYKYFTFIGDSRTVIGQSLTCSWSPGLHENAYFSAGFLNPKILFINFNQKKWLTAVRKNCTAVSLDRICLMDIYLLQ